MPDYRWCPFRVLWGAGFANALEVAYPLDNAMTYTAPREGSEFVQGASGVEDAWLVGEDCYLEGLVRWVPKDTRVEPHGRTHTGWDGAAGWRAALSWARGKPPIRLVPNADTPAVTRDFYLVEPMETAPEREPDGTRVIRLKLRTVDGLPVEGY